MTEVQVAIVGFGKGGRIYNAPIISSVPGMVISKILSSSRENISAAKEDFPAAKVVSELEDILTDPKIDLVVITLPNHLHREFAEKALKAGKHVVVEKPFTPTSQDADALIALAEKQGKIITVHHNRRWASDIRTIDKILKNNELGHLVEFEAHFDRFRPAIQKGWKEKEEVPGSGLLYDLGSHLIDQALVLFGHPTEVFASLEIQREDSQVTDAFEVLLFYPGLKVILKAGMLVKEKGPTYSIHGRKGSFVKYGGDPQEELMKAGMKPADTPNWGVEPEQQWGKLNTIDKEVIIPSEAGSYISFYENVYKCIIGKESLIVTPQQARDVIKVIELAIRSNEEKRTLSYS